MPLTTYMYYNTSPHPPYGRSNPFSRVIKASVRFPSHMRRTSVIAFGHTPAVIGLQVLISKLSSYWHTMYLWAISSPQC